MKQLILIILMATYTSLWAWETQYGLASIYSDDFQYMLTQSGEQYETQSLTAAHPSLPFGTIVQVTNIRKGTKVNVRINDRGPFIKGFIIEISNEAATALGIKGKDAKVKVKVIQEPRKLPDMIPSIIIPEKDSLIEDSTSVPETIIEHNHSVFNVINERDYPPRNLYKVQLNPILPKGYGIQIGIYANLYNALRKAAMLQENWGSDIILIRKEKETQSIYVLLIGSFVERDDAVEYKKRIAETGTEGFIVRVPFQEGEHYNMHSLVTSKVGYAIRLRDFDEKESIFAEVEPLRKQWFKNIMINVILIDNMESKYQLLLGPFPTEDLGRSYLENLRKKGIKGNLAQLD